MKAPRTLQLTLIASVVLMAVDARAQALAESTTAAQSRASAQNDYTWSVDVGFGFDNSISGNINSSAIGTLAGQAVVIGANSYEDVYGTGVHLRFGGGYAIDEKSELRAALTYESLDAELTRMGDLGRSNLYGQYDDYKSLALEFGYRRYAPATMDNVRVYAEGLAGLAFIDEIDVQLVAPQANVTLDATDFYDRTAAFTLAVNGGVLFRVADQLDLDAHLGVRYVTGLSAVDALVGTGLQDINDNSGRWTLPFVVGLRARF